MAGGKLSALKIRNAKTGMHLDGDGLYLQVRGGAKSWIFRYRHKHTSTNGKPLIREMGLGGYPLFSLAQARERRDDQRRMLADGIDPIEHRRFQRAGTEIERAKAVTFRKCAERYIETHRHGWKSAKHADQWTATLEKWVYPHIGQLPVASIDTALVMKVLQQRVGKGEEAPHFWNSKTETASRVRGRIEAILGWARAQKLRTGDNPASWIDLKHLLPAKSQVAPVEHHKALPYAEMPGFMAALRANDCLSARALEFTILTAVRTNDTIGATEGEIDREAKSWTIPAGRVKGKKGARKRDHIVPLSDRALEILGGSKGDATSPVFALSNMAMLELLRDMRPGEELTVHGMRSSFKDWCSEQTAYPNELSELALAHTVSDKVEAAYRRGDMRDKRRRMMDDWAKFCASPSTANKGDNVLPLRA
jgi:integrase